MSETVTAGDKLADDVMGTIGTRCECCLKKPILILSVLCFIIVSIVLNISTNALPLALKLAYDFNASGSNTTITTTGTKSIATNVILARSYWKDIANRKARLLRLQARFADDPDYDFVIVVDSTDMPNTTARTPGSYYVTLNEVLSEFPAIRYFLYEAVMGHLKGSSCCRRPDMWQLFRHPIYHWFRNNTEHRRYKHYWIVENDIDVYSNNKSILSDLIYTVGDRTEDLVGVRFECRSFWVRNRATPEFKRISDKFPNGNASSPCYSDALQRHSKRLVEATIATIERREIIWAELSIWPVVFDYNFTDFDLGPSVCKTNRDFLTPKLTVAEAKNISLAQDICAHLKDRRRRW